MKLRSLNNEQILRDHCNPNKKNIKKSYNILACT